MAPAPDARYTNAMPQPPRRPGPPGKPASKATHGGRDKPSRREQAPGAMPAGQRSRPWDERRRTDEAPPRTARPRDVQPGEAPSRGEPPSVVRNGLWLYGLHPVAAALANPSRRLRRLMLTAEAEAALVARLPPPWPLQPERVDRARVDQLLGRETVHQGAALLADLLPQLGLAAVLERPGPVLVLDQVSDPRNVGAVLRSAAAFGAACVVTQERNAPDETGALAKAASGALETVPVLRAVNIARTLAALKAAGIWCVGLDAGAPPLRGASLAGRRVALVLGAEGGGLRRLVRETCDEVAGLAMPGSMESLNVSAAATVALYELGRGA
jgi:23S rRNA (guanosine2251-2'-O)-methyltransferase